MNKSKTITLQDGRKIRIRKNNYGIILIRGCRHCGHGLLINNGTNVGICVWESKEYQLNSDFVNEIRSKA